MAPASAASPWLVTCAPLPSSWAPPCGALPTASWRASPSCARTPRTSSPRRGHTRAGPPPLPARPPAPRCTDMRTPRYPRLAYVVHELPGRIRYRLRWLRDEPEIAPRLADALAALDGVADVEVKLFTGSVWVGFDPERTRAELVTRELLRAAGLRRLTRPGAETEEE